MGWYVYMLLCGDNTLYTGMTDNVDRRLAAHRAGKGARYTRGRGPLQLVYTEELEDRSAALRREAALKRLSRREKDQLRRGWGPGNRAAEGQVPAESAAKNEESADDRRGVPGETGARDPGAASAGS